MSGVVIVDSGGANLTSVQTALRRLGVEAPVVQKPEAIANAGRVLLPGVGAAAAATEAGLQGACFRLVPGRRTPWLRPRLSARDRSMRKS